MAILLRYYYTPVLTSHTVGTPTTGSIHKGCPFSKLIFSFQFSPNLVNMFIAIISELSSINIKIPLATLELWLVISKNDKIDRICSLRGTVSIQSAPDNCDGCILWQFGTHVHLYDETIICFRMHSTGVRLTRMP